ncbi:hypothetical protein [Fundidesulfovibrio agrisoli]|uniref:hypothetical protein n=1 Tax=Fundidesulfovibrio agrisoli TaxID=2922717 RepID=UPI001FADB34F|nr:hypothetical protein [Fundidesulfovibrio agrisoli]
MTTNISCPQTAVRLFSQINASRLDNKSVRVSFKFTDEGLGSLDTVLALNPKLTIKKLFDRIAVELITDLSTYHRLRHLKDEAIFTDTPILKHIVTQGTLSVPKSEQTLTRKVVVMTRFADKFLTAAQTCLGIKKSEIIEKALRYFIETYAECPQKHLRGLLDTVRMTDDLYSLATDLQNRPGLDSLFRSETDRTIQSLENIINGISEVGYDLRSTCEAYKAKLLTHPGEEVEAFLGSLTEDQRKTYDDIM